jgi:anti-anti-sigma factor
MTVATVQVSAENGSIRIGLGGELDRANAATVEQEIFTAISDQPTAVSVDLTNVTYMDSAGKRILFAVASRLQESHVVLEIVVPFDSPIRRLIELSGLESLAALQLMRRDEIGPMELVMPAEPYSLKNIRDAMRRWLSSVGAGPRVVADLLIAVGEACTNAVEHAYGADGGIVTVHLELQLPDVVATIADTGRWRLPSGENPRGENRGLGMLYMRACADDVRIDRGPSGTTVVIRRCLAEAVAR